ncbi:hypothetical protein J4455_01180 [Candidatus Woesearchaeota archaeon]|nr:hypothetical protein [Candidatus Woesearchaeota archaeon]
MTSSFYENREISFKDYNGESQVTYPSLATSFFENGKKAYFEFQTNYFRQTYTPFNEIYRPSYGAQQSLMDSRYCAYC